MTDLLPWTDLETTGLDDRDDAILEIAVVLTDQDLNVVDTFGPVVLNPGPAALERMIPLVRDMHTTSGLLAEVEASTLRIEDVDRDLAAWLRAHGVQRGTVAGSSVRLDRAFIQAHLPLTDDFLHYRIVDVSSWKERLLRLRPDLVVDEPWLADLGAKVGHRAMDDILCSIAELDWYETHLGLRPAKADRG